MCWRKVEVRTSRCFALLQRDGGGSRHGGFQSPARKNTAAGRVILRQLQRVPSENKQYAHPPRALAACNRALFSPAHAHGIAKGAENHLPDDWRFPRSCITSHRQHADRTTGAVNKLHVFGRN